MCQNTKNILKVIHGRLQALFSDTVYIERSAVEETVFIATIRTAAREFLKQVCRI